MDKLFIWVQHGDLIGVLRRFYAFCAWIREMHNAIALETITMANVLSGEIQEQGEQNKCSEVTMLSRRPSKRAALSASMHYSLIPRSRIIPTPNTPEHRIVLSRCQLPSGFLHRFTPASASLPFRLVLGPAREFPRPSSSLPLAPFSQRLFWPPPQHSLSVPSWPSDRRCRRRCPR
jgi:hypothetical protein